MSLPMLALHEVLGRVAKDFSGAQCAFAVVGGFAVSARVDPRFTRDIDLVVALRSDAEAEHLITSLRAAGYEPIVLVEQDDAKRLATVRLRPTWAKHTLVDLLFASSGIEAELVRDAEPLEIVDGVMLPVATVPYLLALKVLSRDDKTRPQDIADLRQLSAVATGSDWTKAEQLAVLIGQRGYARGRDLVALLHALRGGSAT